MSNDLKARFMGKITASVTHELQNVLAVIKENAGLMEDVLMMADQAGGVPDSLRNLSNCLERVKTQGYRGVDLTSRLNGFSHAPDTLTASFNPGETAQKIVTLSKRIFKLKGTEVVVAEPEQASTITTDLLLFQAAVVHCIETLIQSHGPAIINLDLDTSSGRTTLNFSPENGSQTGQDAAFLLSPDLVRAWEAAGGTIKAAGTPDRILLTCPGE